MSDPAPTPASIFAPTLPEFAADPYPFYHRLRTMAPIHWSALDRSWVLTRYADVAAVLRDSRFVVQKTLVPPGQYPALEQTLALWMLQRDPPAHTRLRALVTRAFTPRAVDRLRSHIEEIVAGLLDCVEAAGTMEMIRDLAFPLPVAVIAALLGVPPDHHDAFKRWSKALAAIAEPPDLLTPETLQLANQATIEFTDYFRALVAEKRRAPGEDVLSALIAAEEQGERLSLDELLANAILLLFAGHETTVNLIGNGILSLLRHPDQLALLRQDSALIKSAVEEFLRFESSIQATTRQLAEDVAWGGHTFRTGDLVTLALGVANRDPEQFADPDRLDITRADNRHLAFGAGIHYCVGAPLSRLEAQVAIPMLLSRMPRLRLAAAEPRWRTSVSWRGLKELPLAF